MKVLIVDDHPIVRRGIKSILAMEDNTCEVCEASSVQEALSSLRKDNIDIVIADLQLGNESGLEVISKGRIIRKNAKYIVLACFISEIDFLKAEAIGVDGYILKDAYVEDIIYAVGTIMRGRRYYDPSVVSYRNQNNNRYLVNNLTLREKDVLNEVSKGLSNIEIAQKLYLSESTVKKHVSSILSKLNFEHRSQVVYYINSYQSVGVR